MEVAPLPHRLRNEHLHCPGVLPTRCCGAAVLRCGGAAVSAFRPFPARSRSKPDQGCGAPGFHGRGESRAFQHDRMTCVRYRARVVRPHDLAAATVPGGTMTSAVTQDPPPQPPEGTAPDAEQQDAGVRAEEYLYRDESRLRAGSLLTSRTMARRLPSLVRRSVRMAWRVDRGATVGLLMCQIGTGVLAALGLPGRHGHDHRAGLLGRHHRAAVGRRPAARRDRRRRRPARADGHRRRLAHRASASGARPGGGADDDRGRARRGTGRQQQARLQRRLRHRRPRRPGHPRPRRRSAGRAGGHRHAGGRRHRPDRPAPPAPPPALPRVPAAGHCVRALRTGALPRRAGDLRAAPDAEQAPLAHGLSGVQ